MQSAHGGPDRNPLDWQAEVAYVYECLCREVADTPLLANLTFDDFCAFCERHTPAISAGRLTRLDAVRTAVWT